jgi:hypothetical protein
MDGKDVPNCILVRKDGSSPWKALCSPTSSASDACSQSYVLLGGVPGRREVEEKDPLTLAISALQFAGPGGL